MEWDLHSICILNAFSFYFIALVLTRPTGWGKAEGTRSYRLDLVLISLHLDLDLARARICICICICGSISICIFICASLQLFALRLVLCLLTFICVLVFHSVKCFLDCFARACSVFIYFKQFRDWGPALYGKVLTHPAPSLSARPFEQAGTSSLGHLLTTLLGITSGFWHQLATDDESINICRHAHGWRYLGYIWSPDLHGLSVMFVCADPFPAAGVAVVIAPQPLTINMQPLCIHYFNELLISFDSITWTGGSRLHAAQQLRNTLISTTGQFCLQWYKQLTMYMAMSKSAIRIYRLKNSWNFWRVCRLNYTTNWVCQIFFFFSHK